MLTNPTYIQQLLSNAKDENTFKLLKAIGFFNNNAAMGDFIVGPNGTTWTIKPSIITAVEEDAWAKMIIMS